MILLTYSREKNIDRPKPTDELSSYDMKLTAAKQRLRALVNRVETHGIVSTSTSAKGSHKKAKKVNSDPYCAHCGSVATPLFIWYHTSLPIVT